MKMRFELTFTAFMVLFLLSYPIVPCSAFYVPLSIEEMTEAADRSEQHSVARPIGGSLGVDMILLGAYYLVESFDQFCGMDCESDGPEPFVVV